MKITANILKKIILRGIQLVLFFAVRFFSHIFLPIKRNKIVFDNFGGRGFGDNPMYIAKEIIKQGLNYDMVWLVRNMKEEMPPEIRKTKYNSIRSIIEIATSKVWVDNQVLGIGALEKKRKGQYFIQTWHGGGVLVKYVQRAVMNNVSRSEVNNNIRSSHQIDLIISDNKLVSDDYRVNFWLPKHCEIFECGMPSKDGLCRTPDEIAEMKMKLLREKDVKVALYAPTFRDDNSIDGYKCDLEAVRKELEKKTSERWILIVRMHPNAVKASTFFSFNKNIINFSSYPDPIEIIVISDLLITDYSSISSDFLYLDKPVFLLALDLEHYLENCRKLHEHYYTLPYPFCRTNEELITAIDDFDFNIYYKAIKEYKENFLKPFFDGHASERVVERIKNVIEKSNTV